MSQSPATRPIDSPRVITPPRIGTNWLTLPYWTLVTLLFVVPLLFLLRQSVQLDDGRFSLESYVDLLFSRTSIMILRSTFEMSAVVTAGCLLLGFPIAYSVQFLPRILKNTLIGCVVAPFFVTVTVRVFGWFALTSAPSPLADLLTFLTGSTSLRGTGFWVVSLALIQIMMPFAVLPVLSSLAKLDPKIVRSAQSLGASRWRVLVRIVIPLTIPGLLTGAIMVFSQTISAFFVPDILGGGFIILLGNVVVNNISFAYNPHEAAAAAVLLATVSLILIGTAVAVVRSTAGIYRGQAKAVTVPSGAGPRRAESVGDSGGAQGAPWTARSRFLESNPAMARRRLDRLTFGLILGISVIIGTAIMIVPLVMTILLAASSGPLLTFPIPGLSIAPYLNVLRYPGYLDAVVRSVLLGMSVVIIAGVIGTLAAVASRSLPARAGRAFQAAVLAPVVFPSLALGLALFEWFAVLNLRAGIVPLFLGHLVLATPFVIRTVVAGLEHLDPEIEKAARSLGAGRWYTLRKVTLPLLTPSLLSASVFAFWISFDNFTISFFFGSPSTRTIPIQLLVMSSTVVDPRLAAGATLLLVVSVPLIILLRSLPSVQVVRGL